MPLKSPHFYWQVPVKGFQWETVGKDQGVGESALKLTLKQKDTQWRNYYPLKDHTGLSQEFARLQCTETAILDFANQYGQLTTFKIPDPASQDTPESIISLADWTHEIQSVKQMWVLWQMASTRDLMNLSEFYHWTREGIIFEDIYNPIARNDLTPFLIGTHPVECVDYTYLPVTEKTYAGFNKEDPVKPALYLIQHLTNYKTLDRIKPELMLDDHKDNLNLKMKPNSLIGAIWLQCMMAINERKRYASCCTCHRWFELPKNVINKGKKYCADACKSKAYRLRIKKKKAIKKDKQAA